MASSGQADNPEKSSRAMPWACLLGTGPRGHQTGHLGKSIQPLQADPLVDRAISLAGHFFFFNDLVLAVLSLCC